MFQLVTRRMDLQLGVMGHDQPCLSEFERLCHRFIMSMPSPLGRLVKVI